MSHARIAVERPTALLMIAAAAILFAAAAGLVPAQEVVENPAKPKAANAGRVVAPAEAAAISDEGTDEYYFKRPRGLNIAPDGSLALLDENQILLFDKNGNFRANLFKKGQGPGAAAVSAFAQPQWKGTIVKEGDVTVAKNPKEPLYKTPILELKEELSLGGADAAGDDAFGRIRHVVVDDAGTIYILDSQSAHIKVFDASGKYARTIGRKGQGPGEIESPMTLSMNPSTGELAVHQASRRMSYFKTDGTFLRHLSFKEMWALRGRVDSRGHIYITEGFVDEKDPRYETKMLGPDASVISVIGKSPAPTGGGKLDPFMAVNYFIIDRADRLIYGYPKTYEIQFFGPASPKLFKKITKEYDPVPVTAEERAEEERGVPPGMKIDFDFSRYHSAYYRFFAGDTGHLFVQTWEKTKDGKSVHDIFDPEGRFIGRLPLKPSGLEVLKGKYYALEEDEDGYQTLKRYAVTWKIK